MVSLERRTLLKGLGAIAFAGGSVALIPAFGTPDRTQNPADCRARDVSATDKRLVISNWPLYIDEASADDPGRTTLQDFEKRYGINVSYTADVNDNVEFFAKVVNQLGSCQTTKRDLFMLTDWMAARMIQMGWIQELDAARVPNLHQNLISALRAPAWDPHRRFSAPWQSGMTGIAYNKKKVKEVRTIDELLTRSDLKGRVTLLTEMRDTMGLIMLSDGADPAKFTRTQWDSAMDKLKRARHSGQIRAFTGNEYVQDLSAGNVVACTAWSGDIIASGDENLVFVVPESGLMIWADNMLVPNLATHQANAEKWINYYYEPATAARLAAYVNYICPVEGAQQEMEKLDPKLAASELIFPSAETLAQTHLFMALTEVQIRTYESEFSDVTGG